MIDRVLPPSTHAVVPLDAPLESSVPSDWPGHLCPNFSDWRPGDIVVVHRARDFTGTALEAAQRFSTNALIRRGSYATHAALYIGDGVVIDAMLGRAIAEVSVWNYCQTRSLQVKRIDDPSASAGMGEAVVAEARKHLGKRYAAMAVVFSKLWPKTRLQRGALYCSTFVEVAVADATGIALSADPAHRPFYPSVLAEHPDLAGVHVEWRHFRRRQAASVVSRPAASRA